MMRTSQSTPTVTAIYTDMIRSNRIRWIHGLNELYICGLSTGMAEITQATAMLLLDYP